MVAARLTAAVLLALASVFVLSSSQGVRGDTDQDGIALGIQVVAKPHEGDIVEFGIRYDGEDLLPNARYLDAIAAPYNRWLYSSPIEIEGIATRPLGLTTAPGSTETNGFGSRGDDNETGSYWDIEGFGTTTETIYVAARLSRGVRIEFAFWHRGELHLPKSRYLSSRTRLDRIGKWLSSSVVTVYAERTPAEQVRELSQRATNQRSAPTFVDVAQTCVLETLDASHAPDEVTDWYHYGYGAPPDFPQYTQGVARTDTYLDIDAEAVWLFASESSRVTNLAKRPAEGYLFIVRDLRVNSRTWLWFAHFDCTASTTPEGEQSEEIG